MSGRRMYPARSAMPHPGSVYNTRLFCAHEKLPMPAFHAPERHLMGPGPAPVDPQVLKASAEPTLGHLDPVFIDLMNQVQEQLRRVFLTTNPFTVPISAPATGAMEACLLNVLEEGDPVLVCINGVFGVRLAEMARRCRADVTELHFDWGRAVDPAAVRKALADKPAKLVCWVQAETSTGVLSDSEALAAITREAGALSLVDCVTAIAGVPIRVDEWGLDMVYAGTQKCLSVPPGLAPITVGPRALEAMAARKTPPQSWFMDFSLLGGYWAGEGKRAYHHTAPVNAVYGLHEGLRLLLEEGLEASWARHAANARKLWAGLEVLGIELVVPLEERLPPLTLIRIPEGVDDAAFRKYLLDNHKLEIGAGLGKFAGSCWRIGLMGYGSNAEAIARCLNALADGLTHFGVASDVAPALLAAEAA